MKAFGLELRRAQPEQRASIENPTVPVSAANFLAFFGLDAANLPNVTIDRALTVPAFASAVAFLSRTLAALPLHGYRKTDDGPVLLGGRLQGIIHDNPNDEMDGFAFRQYLWQQVFTGGRGLAWIERSGNSLLNIWPFNPAKTSIRRVGMKLVYRHDGEEYPSSDVVDLPFMLKANQTGHYGPVMLAAKALQLGLAMNDYAAHFFAGGGVPPLALVGPLPTGPEAMQRAIADVNRAIDVAKSSDKPLFPIPPGYDLKAVGFEPEKGQLTEARRFQNEELARILNLPPVFIQDLSKGTYTNTEQQDLHLVKHLIGQWAKALEGELNLKLFGRFNGNRYVKHNLDGLLRGDFKTRAEGMARAIQTGQLTPNEARELEERPRHRNPAADELLVQGATVVLGSQPAAPVQDPKPPGDDAADGEADDEQA